MVEIDVDSHKLMYHPDRVSKWEKDGDCFPIYIEIGPTNVCNHRCIFCALDYLEKGGRFIDRKVMIDAIQDMAEHGVKSIMFAGEGEPLLHKDIAEFVAKAKDGGMDISITTNGLLFTKEKMESILPNLTWIRFSVNAGSPEMHAKIHGTSIEDFGKIMDNLREAAKFKKEHNLKVTIGVQLLMIPDSMGEAVKLAKKLKEIGVDNIQLKPYSHHPKSKNDYSVSSEDANRLKQEILTLGDDKFKVFFRESTLKRIESGIDYPVCYGLPFFALIDSYGAVFPCNLYYKDEEHTYGNLYENKFSEIWQSEKRKKIVEELNKKGVAGCRRGCRLDVINRYLHRIKNPSEHDNFI